jgi:hypothetical protein
MLNIRTLTDDELHSATLTKAHQQREVTLDLLKHLNEIERRQLFSKFKCSSLHDYCVTELKMTSGSACHHINAARLLKEIPAIEAKVSSGVIAMTTVAQAQAFFRREARAGNQFDTAKKQKVLTELEEKSTREADKILISNSEQPEIHFKERLTQRTETIVEMKLHFDEETVEALNRLKDIWSHAMPNANYADLIKRAAKESVSKNDPLEKARRSQSRAAEKAVTAEPRSVKAGAAGSKTDKTPALGLQSKKAEVKRAVWLRDQARCTFVDSNGVRCTAKRFVEEDHIRPKAIGGEYRIENIRLRCRTHNQRHAVNVYGWKKMREHIQRH